MGLQSGWICGERHREDGPAIEYPDGCKWWYINGKLHRENGPAVEWNDGTKYWYIHGGKHREDGPAVEHASGGRTWFVNDKKHRIDGPAIIWFNGDEDWWIDGNEITETQHTKYIQLINKRERKIQYNTVRRWTDWLMDPNTERGQRFIDRQYQRMMEIN